MGQQLHIRLKQRRRKRWLERKKLTDRAKAIQNAPKKAAAKAEPAPAPAPAETKPANQG